MKFHHVGVACSDIREEIESIRKIHEVTGISPIVYDEQQRAELCMIDTAEGVSIELISGEQVAGLVKKRIAYYHLCFETTTPLTPSHFLCEVLISVKTKR